MKKTVKYFAAFALCFCILTNCLPVQAAAPTTKTCTVCGKTAYYSGSEEKAAVKTNVSQNINGVTHYYYIVWYDDLYRCGCGAQLHYTREEAELR